MFNGTRGDQTSRSTLQRRLRRLFTAALLSLAIRQPGTAQVVTATLSGTVTDQTGALIPNAAVEVKNLKNGFARRATANGSGLFTFAAMDSGDYALTIMATNFQRYVVRSLHLDPGDTRTLNNIHLTLGEVDQTVTVEASASSLDTGERSSLISAETIAKLSIQGRDVGELLKILPGSAIAAGQSSQQGSLGASNTAYDPGNVSPGGRSASTRSAVRQPMASASDRTVPTLPTLPISRPAHKTSTVNRPLR